VLNRRLVQLILENQVHNQGVATDVFIQHLPHEGVKLSEVTLELAQARSHVGLLEIESREVDAADGLVDSLRLGDHFFRLGDHALGRGPGAFLSLALRPGRLCGQVQARRWRHRPGRRRSLSGICKNHFLVRRTVRGWIAAL